MVAEARHVRAMGVRGVDDHGALARLDRDAVDFDVDQAGIAAAEKAPKLNETQQIFVCC